MIEAPDEVQIPVRFCFAPYMAASDRIGPVDSTPNVLLGCAASLPYGVSRRRRIRT